MRDEWIIEVITDLTAFARQNEMNELAQKLDETYHVAVAELTLKSNSDPKWNHDA